MSEALPTLCPASLQTDVVTDLRALWAGIGMTENNQQTQLDELAAALAAQLRGAVQREESAQARLQDELESMERELVQLSATQPELGTELSWCKRWPSTGTRSPLSHSTNSRQKQRPIGATFDGESRTAQREMSNG